MAVQKVTVKGRLMCGGTPASGHDTSIKLVSKNMGFDDTIAGVLASDGSFTVTLNADRHFTISPQLYISTTYAAEALGIPKGCRRLQRINVSQRYVNGPTCDVGTRDLATKAPDEEQDCS